MSAFTFYTDAEGHVCGGHGVVGELSSETWRIPRAIPVRSLEECGFVISWPADGPFTHDHITPDTLPEQEKAA